MKQPWWALLVVAVLGAGAGVGVAVAVGDETSDTPSVIEPESAPSDSGTTAVTSTAVTTVTTTAAPTTTASSTTTTSSTTSTTTTTTEPEPVQPPLDEITIVIANGAGTPGLASGTAGLLREIGYPTVEAVDGSELAEATVMYVRDGLEPTAERVIEDIKIIVPDFVLPASTNGLDEAPALRPAVADADIIVYIGANTR